jgi:hypothetical protein
MTRAERIFQELLRAYAATIRDVLRRVVGAERLERSTATDVPSTIGGHAHHDWLVRVEAVLTMADSAELPRFFAPLADSELETAQLEENRRLQIILDRLEPK